MPPPDDFDDMSCARWIEAISAIADGEDPGVDARLVDAHLARCAACRQFQADVEATRSRTRISQAPTIPDLSGRIAKLAAIADRASGWGAARWLLGITALQMIVLAAPALILGEEPATSPHGARHLGAFSIAYAVGLLVVVLRPARARTMLPVAQVLGGALVLSAVADVAGGNTGAFAETAHLPDFLSVALVWLLARPAPTHRPARHAGPPLRAVDSEERHDDVI